jgi:hypothetical protein
MQNETLSVAAIQVQYHMAVTMDFFDGQFPHRPIVRPRSPQNRFDYANDSAATEMRLRLTSEFPRLHVQGAEYERQETERNYESR